MFTYGAAGTVPQLLTRGYNFSIKLFRLNRSAKWRMAEACLLLLLAPDTHPHTTYPYMSIGIFDRDFYGGASLNRNNDKLWGLVTTVVICETPLKTLRRSAKLSYLRLEYNQEKLWYLVRHTDQYIQNISMLKSR